MARLQMSNDEWYGSQFDFLSGRWEKDKGMELAGSSSKVQDWKAHAEAFLFRQKHGAEITADDLIRAIGVPNEGANKNNVVGAWFNAKAKERKIVWTGRMQRSNRVSRHTGLHRIWIVK